MKKEIEKTTLWYLLLKTPARLVFLSYYKKIQIFGKENIPYGHPIIFAPNHENALMDALAVLFTQKISVVFLARADIFKSKRTEQFLNLIKILPIYRQRDGIENLKQNDEIFDAVIRILKKKYAVCIMPEGSHGDKHRLRQMVKGIFRIAFSAQEMLVDKEKSVKIVPVSLYYSHYIKSNAVLCVNYGKPIDVAEYMEAYRQNQPVANNILREDLRIALTSLMINIQNEAFYDCFYYISRIYNKEVFYNRFKEIKSKAHRKYKAQQHIIEKLENAASENNVYLPQLDYFTKAYQKGLDELGLRDWVLEKEKYSLARISANALLLLIALPLYLYGTIIHLPIFSIPVGFSRKFKDLQFHSSVKFVIALVIFMVYYPILFAAVSLIFKSLAIGLAFIVTLPFAGILALRVSFLFKKTRAMVRYNTMVKQKNKVLGQVKKIRKSIFLLADNIIINR